MNAPDYLAMLKAENEKKTRLPGTEKTEQSLYSVSSVPPRAEKNHISCSTCAHVCRSGCCGEPVAAGLSDLPGVIRYHPDQGTTCPAWQARGGRGYPISTTWPQERAPYAGIAKCRLSKAQGQRMAGMVERGG